MSKKTAKRKLRSRRNKANHGKRPIPDVGRPTTPATAPRPQHGQGGRLPQSSSTRTVWMPRPIRPCSSWSTLSATPYPVRSGIGRGVEPDPLTRRQPVERDGEVGVDARVAPAVERGGHAVAEVAGGGDPLER